MRYISRRAQGPHILVCLVGNKRGHFFPPLVKYSRARTSLITRNFVFRGEREREGERGANKCNRISTETAFLGCLLDNNWRMLRQNEKLITLPVLLNAITLLYVE